MHELAFLAGKSKAATRRKGIGSFSSYLLTVVDGSKEAGTFRIFGDVSLIYHDLIHFLLKICVLLFGFYSFS